MGRVLMSWIDPTGRTRIGSFLVAVTEPILGPVRKLLPRTGMIDFSPLIVILVRVAAAPIDGAANETLLRMLARALRVPRTSLRLVGGRTARLKRVAATGVT